MQDSDDWKFEQSGDPEPFEDLKYYNERFKRDRLNREIVVKYLAAAGWDVRDDRFWSSNADAIYYEQNST